MRGTNGTDANNNTTFDTINAAAFAIASASHNRLSQPPSQKKGWGSWLSKIGCFGYQRNRKRIGHAILVPETTPNGADPAATVTSTQPPTITLPFAAPPSSPASFFQSEPPSTAHSPVGKISHTCVSASMYSPGGPASIFAIGPFAHETQLVSPPVFSASSTAPFTPPPESVHLTTPSSPEVPFAQLLDPNNKNADTFQRFQISHYDFQSYQFHPGSPVGQLISPRSAISASGASSPLPDSEINATLSHILDFQRADPPKLLSIDKLSAYENRKSNQGSGSLTPDAAKAGFLSNHWVSEIKMSPRPSNNRVNEISINHRVSFDVSAQKVLESLENKPAAASAWTKVMSKLKNDAPAAADREEKFAETGCSEKQVLAETHSDQPLETNLSGDDATVYEKDQSLTLASAKEFNFDKADGGDSLAPNIVADWWANEKVAGKERGATKDWSFFPMIQPGVS
ncbi:uncharacterized protein LOC114178605 isoform X2 [Vigna unguiculata]|uniref:Hydroxyproline-rich glycoprotein family protein n=1 Tax=Vigna unguiculata TaxID=3917 RepID=A0A4D6L971_VIGUN|nr:uncharacterized protein LOC114178605 isoform X2 [Vigna unguiculata]QCD85052.1 hypothetical protein DEO72_LG2g5411 [Vigna unguiculata]